LNDATRSAFLPQFRVLSEHAAAAATAVAESATGVHDEDPMYEGPTVMRSGTNLQRITAALREWDLDTIGASLEAIEAALRAGVEEALKERLNAAKSALHTNGADLRAEAVAWHTAARAWGGILAEFLPLKESFEKEERTRGWL
jgi:hypothetical protein